MRLDLMGLGDLGDPGWPRWVIWWVSWWIVGLRWGFWGRRLYHQIINATDSSAIQSFVVSLRKYFSLVKKQCLRRGFADRLPRFFIVG